MYCYDTHIQRHSSMLNEEICERILRGFDRFFSACEALHKKLPKMTVLLPIMMPKTETVIGWVVIGETKAEPMES